MSATDTITLYYSTNCRGSAQVLDKLRKAPNQELYNRIIKKPYGQTQFPPYVKSVPSLEIRTPDGKGDCLKTGKDVMIWVEDNSVGAFDFGLCDNVFSQDSAFAKCDLRNTAGEGEAYKPEALFDTGAITGFGGNSMESFFATSSGEADFSNGNRGPGGGVQLPPATETNVQSGKDNFDQIMQQRQREREELDKMLNPQGGQRR